MIDLYSSSSNLGDNLGLTPLCLATKCRIHMYDDAGCRGVAPIFDGLGEVIFDNSFPDGPTPQSNDPTHIRLPTTLRHLIAYGFEGYNAIPRIILTENELNKAREFITQFTNPYIIKCSPQVTDQRTPPPYLMASIVQANPDITFLQFGLSPKHFKYNFANLTVPGIRTFFDLSIREQAAIYAVVGKYVGADTGDYHLMLAVGGKCDILVPSDSPSYPYSFFHYGPDCWAGQPPRAAYHNWHIPLGNLITNLSHD